MMSLHISMFVPGLPFQGDTLETQSLGGSETAAIYMAEALSKLGHRVEVFCNTDKPGRYGNVLYHTADEWAIYAQTCPHDVSIVQRHPGSFCSMFKSKLNVAWSHDLASSRDADNIRSTVWNIDLVMVLSKFMKDQYLKVLDLPEELFWQTRNGIDLDSFPSAGLSERDRKLLLYSARPERGLDVLLKDIAPRLFEADPELKIGILGYQNDVEHLQGLYSELAEISRTFGDRVKWLGHLPKRKLYDLYAHAGVYVYPTPSPISPKFSEISCISAMECMAAGLPIVTSRRGALPETIGDEAGLLIGGDPWTEDYRDKFCDAVLRYVQDDNAWNAASDAGLSRAAGFGWDGIAEEWSKKFEQSIIERNISPVRLARHFIRQSDISAADATLDLYDADDPCKARARMQIEAAYGFRQHADAFAAHYLEGGEETLRMLRSRDFGAEVFENTAEKRFHKIEGILTDRDDLEYILDYGCGHGWSMFYLGHKLGRTWTGVDIDPGAIEWCNEQSVKHGRDNLAFTTGDHLSIKKLCSGSGKGELFDAAVMSEILEHCIDPEEVIDCVEARVKKNGLVIVTVPYGPVEYGSDNWKRFRNHIHEIDADDLQDMFSDKPGFNMEAVFEGANTLTGDTVGFYLVTYRADHVPVGRRDMDRKLKKQRPRQTLSVAMIAGPGVANTLRWCLESVADIADEIVIADTGLSPESLAIAEDFGAILIEGSNPIEHGFETPRNESIDACTMDWILWIDADERLIGTEHVRKYLRSNIFNGYSIRQHHFCVDGNFSPDMPVRLFRNEPHEGKMMRFFGMIHEHPEFALNEGPGRVIVLSDINIAHVGYLSEAVRRQRFSRNYPLLKMDIEKYPDRRLQKHMICRDNTLLNKYELQTNGGHVTPAIKERAQEVIDLYRKYFQGTTSPTNVNTLEYYSSAVYILGIGFETQYTMAARRDTVGDKMNGGPTVWFANEDDMKIEMENLVRQKVGPLTGEYF